MEITTETIDGGHVARYTDLGTLEERMVRLEEALGEPPSGVLRSLMPQRHEEGKVSIELQCRPCGFYIDAAPTLEEAKTKAREMIARNEELHKRRRP